MIQGFELKEDYVQFFDKIDSWEKAVSLSAKPLLEGGQIKQSYIDGMIASVKTHGPYIVIAPNIAIPHAKPETGSLEVGFCVMRVEESVSFSEDGTADAKLFIALSCVDEKKHIEMLQGIVMVLSDEKKQAILFKAKTKKEIIEVFNTTE